MRANLGRENIIEGELWMAIGCWGAWRELGSGDIFLVFIGMQLHWSPIIANHVTPRCIICSDEWSAYNQLSATTGHVHCTVNHSLYFVDPATGAHTQRCRRHVD